MYKCVVVWQLRHANGNVRLCGTALAIVTPPLLDVHTTTGTPHTASNPHCPLRVACVWSTAIAALLHPHRQWHAPLLNHNAAGDLKRRQEAKVDLASDGPLLKLSRADGHLLVFLHKVVQGGGTVREEHGWAAEGESMLAKKRTWNKRRWRRWRRCMRGEHRRKTQFPVSLSAGAAAM